MAMVDSVVGVLAKDFVPLPIPGQLTTEMIQMVVVEDVVCPGGYTSNHNGQSSNQESANS